MSTAVPIQNGVRISDNRGTTIFQIKDLPRSKGCTNPGEEAVVIIQPLKGSRKRFYPVGDPLSVLLKFAETCWTVTARGRNCLRGSDCCQPYINEIENALLNAVN